jgi:hypothetical protein
MNATVLEFRFGDLEPTDQIGGTEPGRAGGDEFPALLRSVPAAQRRHLEGEMTLDLFVGIPVTDYAAALPWYEQFFGARPSFLSDDTKAAWEVAEHRYVYIVQEPGTAENALVQSFVDDLGDRVTGDRLAGYRAR